MLLRINRAWCEINLKSSEKTRENEISFYLSLMFNFHEFLSLKHFYPCDFYRIFSVNFLRYRHTNIFQFYYEVSLRTTQKSN